MTVSETTRKHLLDELVASRLRYTGALTEPEFLGRLFDLRALPTTDYRTAQYPNMLEDLVQRRVRNLTDWKNDWVAPIASIRPSGKSLIPQGAWCVRPWRSPAGTQV